MAGYNELKGLRVKYLSADPANPEDGQVWYNSTTGNLRVQGIGVGAWSSASDLGTAVFGGITFGTQTEGIYTTGFSPSIPSTNVTQYYNGLGWSTQTNFPTSQTGSGGGAGTETAGLVAGGGGGSRTANAFEYDGSTWTATGSLPTAADNIGSCGTETQTDVIMALGRIPPTGNSGNNTTATYNGSTFSAGPNINTARLFGPGGGSGTGTAGLVFGGFIDPSPNAMTNTEEYDGSSWTVGGSLNNASGLNTGWGIQTNTVAQTNASTRSATEQYNGTSWTALPNLANTGGGYANSAGATGNAGWITALNAPTGNRTEEWNFSSTTVTAAAWSSGGALNTSRFGLTGFGTQTAAIAANGDTYPPATGRFTNVAEEYNGATWTNIASTNTSTSFAGSSKLSPAGAGSVFGGEPVSARHEYWDGSTWSEQTDMNTPRYGSAGAGTQTSSLAMAGIADTDATEEWDGSSWTTVANVPFATFNTPGAGSQTAAIIFGGNGPSGLNTTAEYNSGTWTAGGNLISPKTNQGGAGTQTAALSFMGSFPTTASVVTTTEGYDGTAWSTRPSAATARRTLGSAGTQTAALGFGGYTPGKTTATEEFTGEVVTANPASNLSVS